MVGWIFDDLFCFSSFYCESTSGKKGSSFSEYGCFLNEPKWYRSLLAIGGGRNVSSVGSSVFESSKVL